MARLCLDVLLFAVLAVLADRWLGPGPRLLTPFRPRHL